MTVQTVIGNVLLAVGVGLVGTAALGMLRLPDVYNRTNAVAKAAALGVSLVLAGAAVRDPSLTVVATVVVAVAAQLFTAPIAGYAVGRAAYRTRTPLADITHRDDLRGRTSGRSADQPGA